MCSTRAPYVGGIFSILRPFLVNRSLRASLTVKLVLVLSYMHMSWAPSVSTRYFHDSDDIYFKTAQNPQIHKIQ